MTTPKMQKSHVACENAFYAIMEWSSENWIHILIFKIIFYKSKKN